MDLFSIILSCIAVLISGASFFVSYRSHVLNKYKEKKKCYIIISNLLEHYKKFRRYYAENEIYFQIDFLFDIVPIMGNTTALTSDKLWIVESGERFDNYFRKYYIEIQDAKNEMNALSLYTKSKKALFLKGFSLLYLEYIELMYCQYKAVINNGLNYDEAINNYQIMNLPEKLKILESMYEIIDRKKYLKKW